MLHTRLAALALTAAILGAIGCGGSSKTVSTTTSVATTPTATAANGTTAAGTVPTAAATVKVASGKPLTHGQWVARGDVICAHTFTQIDANPVTSASDYARVLPQIALYEQAELAELAKLVPPTSKTNDWQEVLTATRQEAQNTAKLGQSAQSGSFSASSPLAKATEKLEIQVAAISKRNGFKHCSRL